jgi:hypothetical protein
VWVNSIDLTLIGGGLAQRGYCCIGSIYKTREVIAKSFLNSVDRSSHDRHGEPSPSCILADQEILASHLGEAGEMH